jgi:hydroxybutyrate-dimer hydrolase
VVRTTPRGAGAPPITPANVPPISATPGSNAILFDGATLTIPD